VRRRPGGAWYLLSVLALVVAVPLGLLGVVGLAWQDWQHPWSPVNQATLARGTGYVLTAGYGVYGDVWTALAPGDRITCVFSPTAGTARFVRSFVVPDQHRPRHLSGSRTDTAQLGSFTAPTAGTFHLSCASRGGNLAVRAQQSPSGWPPIVLYAAIALAVAALVWIVVLLRLRARSRLLRAALDTATGLVTG
jgi:hypothetical protein